MMEEKRNEKPNGSPLNARVRGKAARVRGLPIVALALAAVAVGSASAVPANAAPANAASANAQDGQGFTWRSYAELGAGASLAGRPLGFAATEAGFYVGNFEFGSYLQFLPLEFGSVELFEAAAVAYGGSFGYAFGLPGTLRPFVKLGLGGIVRERADENGAFDGVGADRAFAANATAGVELPLGGRWKARLWGAYRLVPDLKDYDAKSLSGFDLGASIRVDWLSTIR